MSLVLVGLNHRTAPLPVRERVVFNRQEAEYALRELKEKQSVTQALLLSTCNRTELYAVVPDAQAWTPRMKEKVFFERLAVDNGSAEQFLYQREDEGAVEHLFRVACGLDSMVIGEQEILGQVKSAYDISRSADVVGTVFHRLANRAFRVGKRARSETRINEGAISVAYAAVELAEKIFQSLASRGALLVGAGENGFLCAQHLTARGAEPLLVTNRTFRKAEELAQQLQGEPVPMDRLREAMARVDVVVSTTGSPEALIGPDLAREVMRLRDDRNLVLIDIAVPRDVDPNVDGIRNLFRFDMDALTNIVDQTLTRRQKEIPTVERLVESEVQGFMRWWQSLAAGPVIRDLHRAFEAVREVEVKKNAKRFGKEDQKQLEIFSHNLMRKALMQITTEIKRYRPTNPIEMERLAVLRHVFGLDEKEEEVEEDDDSI